MNITFCGGNGFGFSAEIDTSYEEFYKWYCDRLRHSDEAESVSVKSLRDS